MPHLAFSNVSYAPALTILLAAALGCTPQVEEGHITVVREVPSDTAEATLISHQELADRIEAGNPPLVLDVRSEEEFAGGHIPGAINIPHDQLEERLAELTIEPTDEVVVHCQRGGRAETCQTILLDAGYTNVLDLEGDFGEWRKLELPEEK
jgi:phage shock protein E